MMTMSILEDGLVRIGILIGFIKTWLSLIIHINVGKVHFWKNRVWFNTCAITTI